MRRVIVGVVLVLAALVLWRARGMGPSVELDQAARTLGPAAEGESKALVLAPSDAVPRERTPLAPKPDEPNAASEPATVRALSSVSGIVREPGGRPRRGALVRFVWDDRGRMREVHASTEADGRFELPVDEARAAGDLLATVYHHEFAAVARLGVHAGGSGIELVLGAPAFVTLEARDANERVLDSVSADFSFELAGYSVEDGGGPLWRSPERPRCGWPPVPFFVSVWADGYRAARFGPFDPAEAGSLLVVHLESVPKIRGRVTHRGEPVPLAGISMRGEAADPGFDLELARPSGNPWGQVTRTDPRGQFEFVLQRACRFELRAFALPFGAGHLAPIEFDGTSDVDGLEIELTEAPGSIEGRVTLPRGHGPEEISLWASSGHGYRPLHSDGTFVLPDLAPGPCRIGIGYGVEPEWVGAVPGETWIPVTDAPTRPPPWIPVAPVYTVEVRSGESAHLDIDLTRPALCRLAGELLLGGRPPRLREPFLRLDGDPALLLDLGSEDEFISGTELDERGRFLLQTDAPGTYRLRASLQFESPQGEQWVAQWVVLDRVTLEKGVVSWRLDVPTGALRVLPESAERPLWDVAPLVRWSGRGDLRVFVQHPALEQPVGSRFFQRVPAGHMQLLVEEEAGRRVVLECEVRAGQLTEVVWPE